MAGVLVGIQTYDIQPGPFLTSLECVRSVRVWLSCANIG